MRINDNAPFFSLKDNNGKYFNLTDYVGEKKKEPVKGIILNFFASYCAPCRYELPVLNSLVDEFEQKGIKVVIVGYGEDFDRIMRMLNPLKVDKPIILSDKYSKVGDQFGILGLPITFIIGADGRIKEIILGEIPNIGNVLRKRTAELFR
ncbi:MAG: TlpA family protein disulfide reductase [Nitrospirae bacterium]|nr:TlpA family protein disulfide reductase [Nitrospirota bacterium]